LAVSAGGKVHAFEPKHSRGGGIRTHDLFVPNDTTSGFGDDDRA
jgi:hypothetical protein